MKRATVRPIRRFVLLLDDQPEMVEGGVIVQRRAGVTHHDFPVVRVGEHEDCDFGQGDVVVVSDPNAGRRVMIDGVVYRLVRTSDVIAVVEPQEAR
jgi:co-chaperonin GroES (HSP10)